MDQGALAHSLYFLNHSPTFATKEHFCSLFNIIPLDGHSNDVMIGDQRQDVRHLMTSSAADRRISNNRLRMTNDLENATHNNNNNNTPNNNSRGKLKNDYDYETPPDKKRRKVAKRIRSHVRNQAESATPLTTAAHMQILDHIGKNCKSPKAMQVLDDFAESPERCSQEELAYMTKLTKNEMENLRDD